MYYRQKYSQINVFDVKNLFFFVTAHSYRSFPTQVDTAAKQINSSFYLVLPIKLIYIRRTLVRRSYVLYFLLPPRCKPSLHQAQDTGSFVCIASCPESYILLILI